ncbi:DUF559 domain-containing protein [Arthrobacter sp. Br18]|uniref:endonuclease domain-containing protein n=1 Tax=Arthrobacter sp. Br18 TaxID=1312954 RepID=UPI00138B1915|nr:DUF559 domain-containing protein [Arthrobacter sp. Br18]
MTVIHGVRATSAARTWLDLATILPLLDVIVAGDFLVSCHRRSFGKWTKPLVSLEELGTFLRRQRSVPGLVSARSAYGRLRVGSDSPPETKVRVILEDAGLPRFSVDYPIITADGEVAQWADLANEEFRVMIEYDGAHHLTPEQQFRDMQRDAMAVELGWIQIRLNQLDLRQGPQWIAVKVRRVLERRGYTGP